MTIAVTTPDGGQALFPDGTPTDKMKAALQKKFGGPNSPTGGRLAQNPDTGEVLFLDNGQWKPAQRAVNPKTGEMVAYDGKDWVRVPSNGFKATGDNAGKSEPDYGNMSASDVAKSAVSNAPSSAARMAKDIGQAIGHPVETAEGIASLGKGVLQKLGIMSGDDAVKNADAVGKMLVDRYGSVAGFKKTLATDPVGVLADVSTVLGGGELAAGRMLGETAGVTRALGTAARATNPLSVAAPVAKFGGRVAARGLGITTGAGTEAVEQAFQAGRAGGPTSEAFTDQMRGNASPDSIVADAKAAVSTLRQQRGAEYVSEMRKLGGNTTVLNFNDIDKAVNNTVKTYKGQSISPSVAKIQSDIRDIVDAWKQLPASDFHTPEGLDALKQKVGDIRDNTQYGTPQRVAADTVYNAIKKTITDQAPQYGKIMKGYQEASDQIKEIERTLSVNPKASVDTALRKITSALRDNVNTNFGKRKDLVKFLANAGADKLLVKIAGQALKSPTPRGVVGNVGMYGLGIEALGAIASANPILAAKIVVAATAGSPRVVGEAAHAAGQVSKLPLGKAALGARLTGATQPDSD